MANLVQTKRLKKEFEKITKKNDSNITKVVLVNDKITHWHATINGPTDTPYEGGKFVLNIEFGDNYPYNAPRVSFLTKMLHPNVGSRGNICLDILGSKWSPVLNTEKLLLSLISLLNDPNADDPLNRSIASDYKNNRNEYNRKVKEHVAKNAMS